MAVKNELDRDKVLRADNPYKDPDYKSGTTQKTGGYTSGGSAPTTQTPVNTDPGYVAPNRTLTMPEYSAYDVPAPDPYSSRWQAQIDSVMGNILNRKPFQYDLNSDALYNQAAQRYIQQGQMAMMDTMGQAAALTGGYGNSYAQQAGQQAYQGYLQGLNDNIAQYYQLAYDRYNQEGQEMRNNLSMLNQAEDSDYGRYQDKYNQWYNERAYADNRSDVEWDRNYQYQKDQMSIQDNNYSRLASLIGSYGYNPTDEELAAAGMSRSVSDTMRNAYLASQAPRGGGGGSSSGSGGTGSIEYDAYQALGSGMSSIDVLHGLVDAGASAAEARTAVETAQLMLNKSNNTSPVNPVQPKRNYTVKSSNGGKFKSIKK